MTPKPRPQPTVDSDPELRTVFRRHHAMVRRALAQLGVPQSHVDDAAQDVFVVLLRRIADFDRSRSIKNWLWGIARGVASGYRRSARRYDRLRSELDHPGRELTAIPRPDDALARRQAADALAEFLDSLDDDKCAVFMLSELEGHSGVEIAARLDVNVNTVYARLRAARARFDEALRGRHRAAARLWWLPTLGWPTTPLAGASVGAVAAVVAITWLTPAPTPAPEGQAPALRAERATVANADREHVPTSGRTVRAGALRGTVIGVDGDAIEGARVCLDQRCIRTDGDGAFAWSLDPGPHVLSAHAVGYENTATADFELGPGMELEGVRVVMHRAAAPPPRKRRRTPSPTVVSAPVMADAAPGSRPPLRPDVEYVIATPRRAEASLVEVRHDFTATIESLAADI